MKLSLVVLVVTSSFSCKTTVLGFSSPTLSSTEEKIKAIGKVTKKSILSVEPTTKEKRGPAFSSLSYKKFLESLKEAEKLVSDPTIFKQEEIDADKKMWIPAVEKESVPIAEQTLVSPVGSMMTIKSQVEVSTAPPKTLMRFKLRSNERSETSEGKQTVLVTKTTGIERNVVGKGRVLWNPVGLVDKNSARAERGPIKKFPAVVPIRPLTRPEFSLSKSLVVDEVQKASVENERLVPAPTLQEMTLEEIDQADVNLMTGALYKARIFQAAEKLGESSFLNDALYKTRVLAAATKMGQKLNSHADTEPIFKLDRLADELLPQVASEAEKQYLLLNIPSTYFVHDVCALGL